MPLTVAFPDRKRRQFTLSTTALLIDLVRIIHADFPMENFRLYFQGREVTEELKSFAELTIPENALLRIDDLETVRAHPISDIPAKVESSEKEKPSALQDDQDELTAVLGFPTFSSSKGKSHKHSDLSGYRKTSRAHFRTFRVQRGRGIRADNNR